MANTKTTALTELASGSQADTDVIPIVDISDTTQAASGSLKKFSWGSIKAALKTYFDTLYKPNGSVVSVYRNTPDQSVTSATFVKVQLNAELHDTDSTFDSTTNYRWTPTVAGYYNISFLVGVNASSGLTAVLCGIYKNGSAIAYGTYTSGVSGISGASGGNKLIYMNGTTDYIELFGYGNGTSVVFQSGQTGTYLTAYLARSA